MKLATIAAIAIALTVCKKSDDGNDDTMTVGLLYFLDQTSGNCATVIKTSSTLYQVILNAVPKGGCNQATLTGSDLVSAHAIIATKYDGAIAIATSLNCSAASITAITNAKNNQINGLTQASFDTGVNNARYIPISDLRLEGMNVLTKSSFAYTETEVLALNRLSVDQTRTTQQLQAILQSGVDAPCNLATVSKINTDFAGFLGVDQTANTKAKVTGLGFLTCQYGSSALANNKCSTLNTEF